MTNDEDVLLHARDLSVAYGSRTVLQNVTLTLARGETLAVVGESGSGKSTLLRALARMLPAAGGDVWWFGEKVTDLPSRSLRRRRARLQLVFQDSTSTLDPRMSASGIVKEGLDVHGIGDPAGRADRAARALLDLGIVPSLHARRPHELSGGQRQRVGIARALVLQPDVMLLDEPISSLDVVVQREIVDSLMSARDHHGVSSIVVLHDLAVAYRLADRVIVVRDGRIVEEGAAIDVLTAPRHPYTLELVSAARAAAR